jgi:hypothetical protein
VHHGSRCVAIVARRNQSASTNTSGPSQERKSGLRPSAIPWKADSSRQSRLGDGGSPAKTDGNKNLRLWLYILRQAEYILLAVSKIRPRAVRTFGVPILTVFSFSVSVAETVQPASMDCAL